MQVQRLLSMHPMMQTACDSILGSPMAAADELANLAEFGEKGLHPRRRQVLLCIARFLELSGGQYHERILPALLRIIQRLPFVHVDAARHCGPFVAFIADLTVSLCRFASTAPSCFSAVRTTIVDVYALLVNRVMEARSEGRAHGAHECVEREDVRGAGGFADARAKDAKLLKAYSQNFSQARRIDGDAIDVCNAHGGRGPSIVVSRLMLKGVHVALAMDTVRDRLPMSLCMDLAQTAMAMLPAEAQSDVEHLRAYAEFSADFAVLPALLALLVRLRSGCSVRGPDAQRGDPPKSDATALSGSVGPEPDCASVLELLRSVYHCASARAEHQLRGLLPSALHDARHGESQSAVVGDGSHHSLLMDTLGSLMMLATASAPDEDAAIVVQRLCMQCMKARGIDAVADAAAAGLYQTVLRALTMLVEQFPALARSTLDSLKSMLVSPVWSGDATSGGSAGARREDPLVTELIQTLGACVRAGLRLSSDIADAFVTLLGNSLFANATLDCLHRVVHALERIAVDVRRESATRIALRNLTQRLVHPPSELDVAIVEALVRIAVVADRSTYRSIATLLQQIMRSTGHAIAADASEKRRRAVSAPTPVNRRLLAIPVPIALDSVNEEAPMAAPDTTGAIADAGTDTDAVPADASPYAHCVAAAAAGLFELAWHTDDQPRLQFLLAGTVEIFARLGSDIVANAPAAGGAHELSVPVPLATGASQPGVATHVRGSADGALSALSSFNAGAGRAALADASAESSVDFARATKTRLCDLLRIIGEAMVRVPLPTEPTPMQVKVYRDLWFYLVMLGFVTEEQLPVDEKDPIRALSQASPALASAHFQDYLGDELEMNSAIRRETLSAEHLRTLRARLQQVLGSQLTAEVNRLSPVQCIYMLAVYHLETLRARGGVFYPVFVYLEDKGIQRTDLKPLIGAIADRAFLVFQDGLLLRDRMTTDREDALVLQMQFLLARFNHADPLVRQSADRYLMGLVNRFPHLSQSNRVVRTMLDTLDMLAGTLDQQGQNACTIKLQVPHAPFFIVVPSQRALREATVKNFVARVEGLLQHAVEFAPIETRAVLHEYLAQVSPSSSWRKPHAGMSLAVRYASSGFAPFVANMPAAVRNARPDCTTQNVSSFVATLGLKRHYEGEVAGLRSLLADSAAAAAAAAASVSDRRASMVSSMAGSRRGSAVDPAMSMALHTSSAVAARLRAELRAALQPRTQLPQQQQQQQQRARVSFEAAMYRAAAFLATERSRDQTATDPQLLHLLCWAGTRIFTEPALDVCVSCWSWLIAARPELETRMTGELSLALLHTYEHRMGLFDTSQRNGSALCTDAVHDTGDGQRYGLRRQRRQRHQARPGSVLAGGGAGGDRSDAYAGSVATGESSLPGNAPDASTLSMGTDDASAGKRDSTGSRPDAGGGRPSDGDGPPSTRTLPVAGPHRIWIQFLLERFEVIRSVKYAAGAAFGRSSRRRH